MVLRKRITYVSLHALYDASPELGQSFYVLLSSHVLGLCLCSDG